MKTIIFKNGDKIILRPTGNTYIGEMANNAMSSHYKMLRDWKLEDSIKLQVSSFKIFAGMSVNTLKTYFKLEEMKVKIESKPEGGE